jgi:gamma-glutamyltranspeptidase/glutathione hydrolase
MCRFDPRPGRPNSAGPAKRPLNNTCPTILRAPNRDAALGLRGGRRIVNVATGIVLQLMQGAAPQQAVDAPRLHTEGAEPILISPSLPTPIGAELKAIGHDARTAAGIGGNAGIAARNKNGSVEAGSNALALLAEARLPQ